MVAKRLETTQRLLDRLAKAGISPEDVQRVATWLVDEAPAQSDELSVRKARRCALQRLKTRLDAELEAATDAGASDETLAAHRQAFIAATKQLQPYS